MSIIIGLIIALVVAMLPLAILFGLVGLALLIWSWGRIGRYFINLGRWLGGWRNFIPLSILGTLFTLVLLLLLLFLLPQLKILWIILLILHLIVTVVCLNFAMIAWTVWFYQWFWPKYRRWLWGRLAFLLGQPHRVKTRKVGIGGGAKRIAGSPTDRQPAIGTQPPKKQSMLGAFWALMLGKPPQRVQPERVEPKPSGPGTGAGAQPPKKRAATKRSWFASFWALMLGKPRKPLKPNAASVKVQTTEQSLGQSETIATTAKTVDTTRVVDTSRSPKANKKASPKRSRLGALWALMLGKPSKSGRPRPGLAGAKDSEKATRPSETSAAATARTGATAGVDEAATTPERAKKERPAKRGFFAGISTSIVRGVTFVVGLVFLGVVWVVQKIREGIEWIRIRLNLD